MTLVGRGGGEFNNCITITFIQLHLLHLPHMYVFILIYPLCKYVKYIVLRFHNHTYNINKPWYKQTVYDIICQHWFRLIFLIINIIYMCFIFFSSFSFFLFGLIFYKFFVFLSIFVFDKKFI